MIQFLSEDIEMPALELEAVRTWIPRVVASHGKKPGNIHYIFCSDRRILEVNLSFLQHDYYTDIITFDYTQGDRVSGDIYISLDTVSSNAGQLGTLEKEELLRVIAHGVLHLCGFKDKTPEDAQNMRAREQKALDIRPLDLI